MNTNAATTAIGPEAKPKAARANRVIDSQYFCRTLESVVVFIVCVSMPQMLPVTCLAY